MTPRQAPSEEVEDEPDTPYYAPREPLGPPGYEPTVPYYDVAAADRRRLDAARAEDARFGPLQGAWDVLDAQGLGLFRLQLVNPGGGSYRLEGAWRRLYGPAGRGRVGLIDEAEFNGDQAQFRFSPDGRDDLNVVTVTRGPDGAWRGEYWRAGEVRDVTLRRR